MEKKFVIFDLEATCEDKSITPDFINEIIEIGAVMLNTDGETIDTFSRFAKPQDDTILTDFCINLTTIRQEDIDDAESLSKVLLEFMEWSKDSILLSWGGYDIRQIRRDIERQNIDIDWDEMKERHIDLKRWYSKHLNLKRRYGMMGALEREGIEPMGTHHRGIDDAINIAEIFKRYISEF